MLLFIAHSDKKAERQSELRDIYLSYKYYSDYYDNYSVVLDSVFKPLSTNCGPGISSSITQGY